MGAEEGGGGDASAAPDFAAHDAHHADGDFDDEATDPSDALALVLGMQESASVKSPGGKVYTAVASGEPIGTIHEVFGTSQKATCRLHASCSLFLSSAGRHFLVRNIMLKWLAKGLTMDAEKHKDEAEELKAVLGVAIRGRPRASGSSS